MADDKPLRGIIQVNSAAKPLIYPSVTTLTNNYERVWYGDEAATLEDYAGFIEKYREVAR